MKAGGTSASDAAVNVARSFAVQPEATSQYSFLALPANSTLSTTDPVQIAAVDTLINQVYQNLFNRAADPDGLVYWQQQILGGVVSIGSAVYAIANGAQSADQVVLDRKIRAASRFTSETSDEKNISAGFIAAARIPIANDLYDPSIVMIDRAIALSGFDAPGLTFLGSPTFVFLGSGKTTAHFTSGEVGEGIELITNFQYGRDQLSMDADRSLEAFDTAAGGFPAIAIGGPHTGVVLLATSGSMNAADLLANHVTFSEGQAFIS